LNSCGTASLNVHGVDNTVYTYVCASGTLASGTTGTVPLTLPATLTKPGVYAVEYTLTDSTTAPTAVSNVEHLVYVNSQAGTLEVVPCTQSTAVTYATIQFQSKSTSGIGVENPAGGLSDRLVYVNATLRKL
jgi:hypothetical protein